MLGVGRVGIYALLAPAQVSRGCAVTAVAARDPQRAHGYAATHGIPNVHGSYQALIDDPAIDLVYVATPPFNHAALASASIRAGKPVLVEKPFAMNAEEARRIFNLGRDAGVPVFEAMHSPHHPLVTRIKELVQSGAIGELHRIEARFDAPIEARPSEYRWRSELGGGALMDLGVYSLAWCRRLAGENFRVIEASADIESVDARFEARILFGNGVEAVIGSSLYGKRHQAVLTLEGADGRLDVDNFVAPHRGHLVTIARNGSAPQNETVDGPTTYEAQLEAVRATLVDGRPFPFVDDDYVLSMVALDAVRSAWEV